MNTNPKRSRRLRLKDPPVFICPGGMAYKLLNFPFMGGYIP
nr:MAG TPA: chemokine [Caudoviricetes sp.]